MMKEDINEDSYESLKRLDIPVCGEYDALIFVYLDMMDNVFYDHNENLIENIYELITPNDLYLYYDDPGNCMFPYRKNPRVLVEIVTCDYGMEFNHGKNLELAELYYRMAGTEVSV